jgi:DNA mismatch repair protein MutS
MTPVRRQYLTIKHSYRDAIVLFRLGDFYEAFDEDAKAVSRDLEIVLTARSMGKNLKVPMAGVPAHSLESYLARLIRKGHKVAICEQLGDPSKTRGLVERDVVRVVTPGTVLESTLLELNANNYLAAAVEEGPLVGLAYVDITTGEFAATQLLSEQLPLELERISPSEVLLPPVEDASPGSGTRSSNTEPYHTTTLDWHDFELERCGEALLSHYGILSLESFGCAHLPLAVRAAGAIVLYLEETQKRRNSQLAPLSTYSTGSYMTLDPQTRRNLELFQSGRWENRQLSLLSTLDLTRTPLGARLLRRRLGQPLLDLEELGRRLDTVEAFHSDAFRRGNAMQTLSRVADLERILSRIVSGAVQARELVSLRDSITAAAELREQLSGTQPPSEESASGRYDSLEWLLRQLCPLPEVVDLLESAIAAEPAGSVGDGNVIREGFSPELDELKRASSDARGYIAGLESRERERTGIRNLRVGYNQVFGYYIEVSKANASQVPDDYIRRQTLTNGERYIVPELKEYESLVLNARERTEELERDLYRRVCAQVGESAGGIGKLAHAVAQLDVFASLAEVAVRHNYVRPTLNRGDSIVIKDGRHPVVERVLDAGSYVPNDVHLSNSETRIVVLTGPNMAGKSTYIRQVAIITLMAQVGSFVPAREATIGLVDRIFTRVGLQDDLTTGQSTFMVEMVETAAILNQATPRSLVILDEIGRGTSTYDGLSIARSIIEHLHNDPRLGCKTLFATHYHELTELAQMLPGIRNFSVSVTEENGQVIFLHSIVPGGVDQSYGVHVAQLAGLPRAVINRAWEVLEALENLVADRKPHRKSLATSAEPSMQMSLFTGENPLLDEVLSVDIPNLTPLEAINKLYELQERARNQKGSD